MREGKARLAAALEAGGRFGIARARALLVGACCALSLAASAPRAQGLPITDESAKSTANPFVDVDGNLRSPAELAAAFSGWTVLPEYGFAFQFVDTMTSDPGFIGALMPGFSGHPTKWERFRFQFPHPAPTRVTETALVIGFHGFSITELDVFNNSQLPAECASRGYYLLAPLGLNDENWANTDSQDALDAILDLLEAFFDLNTDRIYTAGFSMGGANALSYAVRRQDLGERRVAGVISHTATLDLIDSYNKGIGDVQTSMQDAFGGPPTTVPFAYRRVSPLIGLGGLPDPDFTNVSNLLHLPIYFHLNLLDSDLILLAQNGIFKNWLVAEGANASITEVINPAIPTHSWSTLDVSAALDFVDGFTVPSPPSHIEFYADRPVPYLYTEPRSIVPDEVARYDVDVDTGGNSFDFDESKHIEEIAFDLLTMGLDPTTTLSFDHETIDATADAIVLRGYRTAPSSVLTDGAAPESWSHDALAEEVTVTPNLTGASSTTVLGPPSPIAEFSASTVIGIAPLSVDFTDESWGDVTNWSWNFGDGTSMDQNPSHVYNTPGAYDVTLIVTGPGGAAGETKVGYVTVLEPPPVPEFSADVTSGDAPLTVQFSDLTTGAVSSWSWDFGDTNSSPLQSPQHTYTVPGLYTVVLTATGPGGNAQEVKTDYILVTDPSPTAEFTSDVTSGDAPHAVQFTDLSTGAVTDWNWDFGDTNSSTLQNPLHTYTAAGDYTVELTVTGPGGVDTETKVAYISISDPAPTADFSADVLSGPAPLTVQFTDASTGTVNQWDWTFGDLGTSTVQNPQHTYTTPGSYTVILNVTGPGGNDLEVKAGYITVN